MSPTFKKFYDPDVKGLGPVAISRHAQDKAYYHHISEEQFHDVLQNGQDTPEADGTVMRDKDHVRLVIIKPTPFKGAMLVKTCFRVEPQARAKK